jgi:hypothetical protein
MSSDGPEQRYLDQRELADIRRERQDALDAYDAYDADYDRAIDLGDREWDRIKEGARVFDAFLDKIMGGK